MSQRQRGLSQNRQPAPILIPPHGFLTLETNLHRAVEPILSEHLPYLKKLKLGVILVVNNTPLSDSISPLVEENESLAIHSFGTDSSSFISNIHLSEEWIKRALEFLFSFGQETVLLLGSADTCIDALIIGCLRKLQKWDMTSIIGEFRHLTGRKIFDMEQFIEFIDIKQTRLPRRWLPNYLECYLELEEEEFAAVLEEDHLIKSKTIASNSYEEDVDIGLTLSPDTPLSPPPPPHPQPQPQLQLAPDNINSILESQNISLPPPSTITPTNSTNTQINNKISNNSGDIQSQQREYLLSLLFAHHPNKCISSSSQYDPSLSLITEDTVDD